MSSSERRFFALFQTNRMEYLAAQKHPEQKKDIVQQHRSKKKTTGKRKSLYVRRMIKT